MKFSSILFPVDFSVRSHAAVPHVRSMAARFNASITLLHVMPLPIPWPEATLPGDYQPIDIPAIRRSAEAHLEAFAQAEFPDIPLTELVEEGDPGYTIAEVAKSRGINLIMMPTHGHGVFRSALIGSTAAKVLHDAHCPVWTAAHLEDTETPQHTNIRAIMCALELDEHSVELLKATYHLADAFSAEAYIVHSVPWSEAQPEIYLEQPLDAFMKESARLQVAKLQEQAHTAFGTCLEIGSVSEVIHNACKAFHADLVVAGRGVLTRFAGGLRTNMYAVIRDAGCPVISLPPREVIL
ncbi:MAG: UspA domain protein [Bryobacterales bacterium]|nr:UspA domain protein [Bryobacterales bacterium]